MKRFSLVRATTVVGALLLSVGLQVGPANGAGAAPAVTPVTGFTQPFGGTPEYQHLAPRQVANPDQINQPIGPVAAEEIAQQLGLNRTDAFSAKQYYQFITGQGVGGTLKDTYLVDDSIKLLTNTVGRPLYSDVNGELTPSVLASYGLFVNKVGLLESLANMDAPTRLINRLLVPNGYFAQWCRANGASASLAALYRSAYPAEVAFGYQSQWISGAAQLVPNQLRGVQSEVGMSMVPSIWLVNFILLYIVNPALAAEMPANWMPIPPAVASAIQANHLGQVQFIQYMSYFPDNGSH